MFVQCVCMCVYMSSSCALHVVSRVMQDADQQGCGCRLSVPYIVIVKMPEWVCKQTHPLLWNTQVWCVVHEAEFSPYSCSQNFDHFMSLILSLTPSHFKSTQDMMWVIDWTKIWLDTPGLTLESRHSICVLHQWSYNWAHIVSKTFIHTKHLCSPSSSSHRKVPGNNISLFFAYFKKICKSLCVKSFKSFFNTACIGMTRL